jgi:endogenous inhibitor of DNA gyrase (YacG/DUF329 family)
VTETAEAIGCIRCGAQTPQPGQAFCSHRCKGLMVRWREWRTATANRKDGEALALRRRADQIHDRADDIEAWARELRSQTRPGPIATGAAAWAA